MAEDILAEIVRRKRVDVAARLNGATLDPRPTCRSLRSALSQPGARFIMEVKKRSPSGHSSGIDVTEAAKAYAPVADAISVLTDGPFFGGTLADLRIVRANFDGPILAKDFIVDPNQVREARLHGADAVLAILSIVGDDEAAQIMAEARRLSMDVIVEVHDEMELGRALALGAGIVGINNRDLRTLQTSLSVSDRLASLVPENRLAISESGIRSRQDAEQLSDKVDAFLVGSSLMASDNVAQAARAMLFGQVKICGLTTEADVSAAARHGATFAGFIFAEGSPRRVAGKPGKLAEEAHRRRLRTVGVFGDQSLTDIARLADELGLHAVQLHGSQDRARLREALPSDCEIWSVSGVGDAAEPTSGGADRTLFDTRSGGRTGGTGRSFDWSLVAGRPDLPTAFLAGGIGPANARAAQKVGAFGIDVATAVEERPGRKDGAKLRALFEALRLPDRRKRPC